MNESFDSLQSVFSQNRAEELGYDVWQHFVVPPFYYHLDLQTARKPRLIIGGRGCGKTMLLRYLSHQSMFSPSRPSIPDDDILHIGLYWRADTQFANVMNKRNVQDDTWHSAFSHMAALILAMEVLSSLQSIAKSTSSLLNETDIEKLNFHRLQAFDPTLPSAADSLQANLEERLWEFESWVSNVRKMEEPRFLPGEKFVLVLIQQIQQQLPIMRKTIYFVYLDEYENLCTYQQEIINTWLKHSETPLIFNIAMKRNAFETQKTTGLESLSDIHDFRKHDLEAYFLQEDLAVFFGEILLLKLSMAGVGNLPINVKDLRDLSKLPERQTKTYIEKILSAARTMFPEVTHEDLAKEVFKNRVLSQKLYERVQLALKQRNAQLSADRFIRPEFPQASIITPALLNRKNNHPEAIAEEMDLLENNRENRFSGRTNWIHNNFIGCLLQLYQPYDRACPFYAGFQTFWQLSRGNIRHFLELCYKSLYRAFPEGKFDAGPVPPSQQAEAARQASTAFLGEVRSFGPLGNRLHTFLLRLGSLFALAHQRPTQSESEQSHFSILAGKEELNPEDLAFVREAIKWSVLFEEEGTKKKAEHQPESLQYVLNPIYAPYFHISYRKKRKLEMKSDDVVCLIRGSYSEVNALLKRYSKTWSLEPSEMSPTLFSHLTEEQEQ